MLFNITIITILMLVAIVLVLAEIFLLPGITLAGIGGFVFAAGGLFYAYKTSITTGNITLAASLILFGIVFLWMLRSKSFNRVALKTDIDSKLQSTRELGIKPGDEGTTVSRLAPIGKARFGNTTVEAKSQDEFIDEQRPVEVVKIEGYNVIVKKKNIIQS